MKMMKICEQTALKIHLDKSNIVWFVAGDGPPRNSGLPLMEFFANPLMCAYPAVRIVGSRENATSVVDLYYLKLKGLLNTIQVCSPQLCQPGKKSRSEHCLTAMRQITGRPASVGGWHEIDEGNYYSYLLSIKTNDPNQDTDELRRVLREHIAWPYLSFIDHLNEESVARLLGLIVDPRWYIDLDDPDKSSKLEAYLGLHPKTQRGISGAGPEWRFSDRCKLVMSSWKDNYSQTDFDRPSCFLWRMWKHHGQDYMADLRTSQKFITFLRMVWLHAIYKNVAGGRRPLFVPEYFFHQDECKAYKDRLLQLSVQ